MRTPGDTARGGETGLAARTLPRVLIVEDEGGGVFTRFD